LAAAGGYREPSRREPFPVPRISAQARARFPWRRNRALSASPSWAAWSA